jgi:hypothetical protein
MTNETKPKNKRPAPVTDPEIRKAAKWVKLVNAHGNTAEIPECDLPAWEFDGWKKAPHSASAAAVATKGKEG